MPNFMMPSAYTYMPHNSKYCKKYTIILLSFLSQTLSLSPFLSPYSCVQTFYLLHEEGFFVGASSGLNVAAAVKVSPCTNTAVSYINS